MQRRIRVATYNVLSSSLCSASYFCHVADEKFCSSRYRLDGLLKKLSAEIDQNAIICLQEVSLAWSGKLHAFLESKDYAFVVSNYGHRFNGFMGVGIAYPRSVFALANADITCVPDTKVGGWSDPNAPRPERRDKADNGVLVPQNFAMAVVNKVSRSVTLPFTLLWRGFGSLFSSLQKIWFVRAQQPRKVDGPWDLAKNRVNTMVCLRLRHRDVQEEDGMDFLVATYHMPCQFWEPATMTIHTAICLQALQQLAENRYPHILAGDFNFKPASPQYEFTTKGEFNPVVSDPEDPEVNGKPSIPAVPLYPKDPFSFTLPRGPYRSAYAEAFGKEPPFTNYAMTTNHTQPFKSTLDYIFIKDGEKFKKRVPKLRTVGAEDLAPACEDIINKGLKSLPSATEYSDHLLLAAEFELSNGQDAF